MGSGFHGRCSLTGSCSDCQQNHYYYTSEGLHLAKSPEGWADRGLRASCSHICRGWGWPQVESRRTGVQGCPGEGWGGGLGDASRLELEGSSEHMRSRGHAGAPAGSQDKDDGHPSETASVHSQPVRERHQAKQAGCWASPCGSHACRLCPGLCWGLYLTLLA